MTCQTCPVECCIVPYKCAIKVSPFNLDIDNDEYYQSMGIALKMLTNTIGKECVDKLCSMLVGEEFNTNDFSEEQIAPYRLFRKELYEMISWRAFEIWAGVYGNKSVMKKVSAQSGNLQSIDNENLAAWIARCIRPVRKMYVECFIEYKKTVELDCIDCPKEETCQSCGCIEAGGCNCKTKKDLSFDLPSVITGSGRNKRY